MPRKWDDMKIDDLLNDDTAHTGRNAQYERIMLHRLSDSVSNLSDNITKISGMQNTLQKWLIIF